MICISETFDKGGKENGGLSRWPLIGGLTTTVRDNQTSSLEQMNMPLYIVNQRELDYRDLLVTNFTDQMDPYMSSMATII